MLRKKVKLQDLFAFVGLDTSVLIDLMMLSPAKEFFEEKIYLFEENLLFTHRMCLAECLGLLIGNYGFSKEEAKEKIRAFLEEFRITILELDEGLEEDGKYVFGIGKKYGWSGDQIINDAIIIASFWRKRMNMVVVRDGVFEKVCKELKMKVLSFPLF